MANPYISEIKYKGGAAKDFVEVAVDTGTNVSGMSITVYNADGTVRTTNALGAVVNTIAGKDIYVIDLATSATFNGLHKFGGVALDDGTTVFQFLSFTDNIGAITATGGAAAGMTSTEVGIAGAGSSLETNDNGATYFTQGAPNSGTIPACFVNGTMILTPQGERAVEDLKTGDLVITKDNGPQKILWAGKQDIVSAELSDFQPILIKANAFSKGTPIRDLLVSPYHRLVIEGTECEMLFGEPELLVPATYLQNNHTIVAYKMAQPFSYHHILFAHHEIIFSHGMATESFDPKQEALDGFSKQSRDEVLALFPELNDKKNTFGETARPVAQRHEAVLIAQGLH
jgi:hypothetical protein